MTATVTDLFCGAGGSSTGAAAAGLEIVMAANHWQTAIDVHQAHHPDAAHDCADITQVDPRRYPRTNVLLASPECTNHSQARGVSRKRQDPTLWDAPDPSAERSRATMWDVVRFAEQMLYDAIVVENVVEATKWVLFPAWLQAMLAVGAKTAGGPGIYEYRILSHNSMHHGVPQSRDRIYIVFWRKGLRPDLEFEQLGWCGRCDTVVACRQAWKNGRTVGRYRQQWRWACTTCGANVEPLTAPAASIIDWSLPCPRIGDRARPLAAATRSRILAGLQRYGWAPITTSGAGNVHERTPGNRARSVAEPLTVQQTTATTALAIGPNRQADCECLCSDPRGDYAGPWHSVHCSMWADPAAFLFQTAHGGRVVDLDGPHPTVTASDDRHALVLTNDHANRVRPLGEPLSTATTGNRHALIVRSYGFDGSGDLGRMSSTPDGPMPTCVTTQRPALVVPLRNHGNAVAADDAPAPTVAAGGTHHGLLMRNNLGGAEMVTPVDEPARTMTTKGHQSLLVPYYGKSDAQPVERPVPTVPTRDRFALVDVDQVVDDCGFRMLEPYEIAAAMAFPIGYIPTDLSKKDQVKLAGNAVTPPVMTWITGRLLQALEAAA